MSFQNVFADHWLPQAPLAAERKDGAYRRLSREHALQLPYIETNPLCLRAVVVGDHDRLQAQGIGLDVGQLQSVLPGHPSVCAALALSGQWRVR